MNILEQQWSRQDKLDNCDDTITSRFKRQVAAVPERLALVTDGISLTYRALDLEASHIAAGLASFPAQRDRPVMLLMKDEAACTAAMLGTLKANRAFIPLAPDLPEKWLAQVVAESETAQIVVDSSTRALAERAANGGVTVISVEQFARSSEPFVADRAASADDTAYILYTSGSTGRSKGVANSHRSFIRRGDVGLRHRHGDRVGNLRSSGSNAWINYGLLPLLSGASVFRFDLPRQGLQTLTPWLIAHNITCVSFSGSLLRTWLATLPDDLRFPALQIFWIGGEQLYAQDVLRLCRHLESDCRIGHPYASTECGIIAIEVFTSSHLPQASDEGVVAVGRVDDGMEVSIRDDFDAPVAPGDTGEIIVRSRFLSQGYWKNPELTAEVFETDPLDSAIRCYRTGDLGRWRSDGTLELLGRKGSRIRLRGYNIEPFEVECELLRQPGVTDAVVLLHDGAAGQEPCLVGYVVAPKNASPSLMRQGLAAHLPSYMVPSHIVVLDSFPIARSGKIDRSALPPPDRENAVAFRAPSDACERELLAIWQEILEIPKIGIDDDFFELGGTSLQVLMMFAEIEVRLHLNLSPTAIVEASTIARLADLIRAANIAPSQSLVPLRASGKGLPLFLVAPGYFGAMFYRDLLKDLKSDRPVFGLQPPPLDGKRDIPRTIETMAANYVGEIRHMQPHGPYFVAGYSFAGRVSFEIAQQLVRDNERVDFVGLIDTGFRDFPDEEWPLVSEAVRLSHKVRRARGLQDLVLRGGKYLWRVVWSRLISPRYRLLDFRLRRGRAIPDDQRFTYYRWLCQRASRRYVFEPYPGHITIFSSAGNSAWQRGDWAPLAGGGLTVLEVPAGHGDMASPPHSKCLAEHFDACLDGTVRHSIPVARSAAS
jgi:acyl-CoA synthetase (AMP-forming)/AMP-acid ligase II/thioesterase domain-containing protein/acyl carrier protein